MTAKECKIHICNLHRKDGLTEILHEPWQVRVDRTSCLGNPYRMRTADDRDAVCDKYHLWLENVCKSGLKAWKQTGFNTSTVEFKEIIRITNIYLKYKKLYLYCHCAPKRCHAKSIRAAVLALCDRFGKAYPGKEE